MRVSNDHTFRVLQMCRPGCSTSSRHALAARQYLIRS